MLAWSSGDGTVPTSVQVVPLVVRWTRKAVSVVEVRRRGEVCGRAELLREVWGLDFDPGTNVVEVGIRRLGRKLLDPPIETIRSAGYCFTG